MGKKRTYREAAAAEEEQVDPEELQREIQALKGGTKLPFKVDRVRILLL